MDYDLDNLYDKTVIKDIDTFLPDWTGRNTMVSNEWFAQAVFTDRWRVNARWLRDNPVGSETNPEVDPPSPPYPPLPPDLPDTPE